MTYKTVDDPSLDALVRELALSIDQRLERENQARVGYLLLAVVHSDEGCLFSSTGNLRPQATLELVEEFSRMLGEIISTGQADRLMEERPKRLPN